MSYIIKYTFFSLFLFSVNLLLAQEKGRLEFLEREYDFGEIQEEDGLAIHEFEFENKGTAPLVISNVRASCGCTTPGWSKEPVMPGERGFVKAQYNPRNRPGNFRKSLTITTNGDPAVVNAFIQGKVIPKVKSLEEQMTVKVGNARFKNRSVNMGRITTEKPVEKSFDIYNDSKDSLVILESYDAPDFIKLTFEPQVLAPKQVGKVVIDYNPVYKDNLGYNNHGIQFYTNEANAAAKKINVIATISEYFAPLSDAELAKAPKMAITDRLQDLGRVSEGSKTIAEFVLTNHGQSALEIRKVKSNCACFVADLPKTEIKPGKSVTLKGTFDATGRKGNQNKSITIYSNDPKDPMQVVSIKASILSSN
ncbi:DUF1573 domain-containing protein [Reichenbachiella carrageenanivorans]|uniref:DUF1573 domain-containing protein n=1 Tax=Reichenbachiella carrageenanivorans TaxID=2979869 RepID=A0ABY6CZE3_9BACT|nr:DUF1573 domain-containing protein [Reichenbachiella carrageenanivorans]UXX79281.1 DUF1573 domain-containing protein [Reichenbachiella carrageenanivorans]